MNRRADRRRSGSSDALRPREILPYIKIPLVPDAHPLQVDPGVGFLRTLEGFSLVGGFPFPDDPLVGSRPALSRRARYGLDITADQRNDFPFGHVVVNFPYGVFQQRREYVFERRPLNYSLADLRIQDE